MTIPTSGSPSTSDGTRLPDPAERLTGSVGPHRYAPRMGFDSDWAFRDCPWCSANDVQMNTPVAPFKTGGTRDTDVRMWQVLSCPRCAGLTVLEVNPEDDWDSVISVLPRDEDLSADIEALPNDVASYLADAVKVMRVGVPDAAAVQLRRTLEAATMAKGANPKKRLVEQVKELIDAGHVTKVFEPALGYIRKVGNVGAHASSERLTQPEVAQALAFTTLLLRNLFELPAQVEALEAQAPPPRRRPR